MRNIVERSHTHTHIHRVLICIYILGFNYISDPWEMSIALARYLLWIVNYTRHVSVSKYTHESSCVWSYMQTNETIQVKFRYREVGMRGSWDWREWYCRTLENGDEESMLVMTETTHCIFFLRERRLIWVPGRIYNKEKAFVRTSTTTTSLP